MTYEKKADPFKTADPEVPGVEPSARKPPAAEPAEPPAPSLELGEESQSRSLPAGAIAIAAVVAVIMVGALIFWLRSSSPNATEEAADSVGARAPAQRSPQSAEKMLVGPGPVATTEELASAWSSKRFLFPDPVTSERVMAMVVHLPDGSYWAFSLREPFGTCELEFVTDLDKLSSDYNFRADHPMIGNPCKSTVYDLLQYSDTSGGALVRGNIVHGVGIRPPMAIEVRVEGNKVVAVRME